MNNSWIMRTWELMDLGDGYEPTRRKPMNTRTRKTAWKERRRRANLPRATKRKVGAK